MKPHLMYRDRDFDMQRKLPSNAEDLTQDLGLNTLFSVMANSDELLFKVAKHAVLLAPREELQTVLYRQGILKDCLRNYSIARNIYDVAVETIENKRKDWFGIFARHPGAVLYGAVKLMEMLVGMLGKLRSIADEHAGHFESKGFKAFFALIKTELTDEYLASIEAHLKELNLDKGVFVSAALGKGNQGVNYVLHKLTDETPWWMEWLASRGQDGLTFRIADRDEAGARTLSQLQDRGINRVANALAQSADHVLNFFIILQTELAFYLGCVNLRRRLSEKGTPICFPVPALPGTRKLAFVELCDVSLALSMEASVVGNDLDAEGKTLCVITGANQGGKSTFLRCLGLAQLMMQSGMFVAAKSFGAENCRGLFTHYKREEDVTMKSGKFDEELNRMSMIVDALTPPSMLLFNESFAATNEREGSEIARQIVRALYEAGAKVFYVTHLYDFAHGLWEEKVDNALFLRAEREADGRRTFKMLPGEPLQTSFGADLYQKIFADVGQTNTQ